MTEHETEIPAESAEQIRQIAREEARDVYDDEVVEADGEEWSVRSMMDRFEISRRTGLGAMGLLIAGVVADPAEAVMRSYVGTAEAQSGDLTVPGTLSADAVSTVEADITGETFVNASRSTDSSSTSSFTFINLVDTENKDNNNEFDEGANAQFNPDESGWYEITAYVRLDSPADQDQITARVRDVDSGSTVGAVDSDRLFLENTSGTSSQGFSVSATIELSAGTNYEVQATNINSSFVLSSSNPRCYLQIKRSVVHP